METGCKTGEKEGMEQEDGSNQKIGGMKDRGRWWKG